MPTMLRRPRRLSSVLLCAAALPLLAACGGGGGSSPGIVTPIVTPPPPSADTPPVPDYVANSFPDSADLKNLCRTVRTDTDLDGNPRPDRQGELGHELFWLRSWMNETYLYYDQVTDRDPNGFTDPRVYFDELLTTTTSAGGRDTDRFSFTEDTEDSEARRSGAPTFGYGAQFARLRTNTLPRDWRVAFTQAGSNAQAAGFTRGAQIVAIDGADFLEGTSSDEINTINAGLFPATVGEDHVFTVRRPDGALEDVTVTSQAITIEPVNLVDVIETGGRTVGYLHYHTFSPFTGEQQLFDAFTRLSNSGVDDLVLDFRYNGGGLLALAAQIGYMTAGGNSPQSTFYSQQFNARNPGVNPLTGQAVSPIPFLDEGVGFSVNEGTPLPTLDLPRVFVLTTGRSCSASEAVMNGLIGIGVDVVQIGTRTCGKSTGQFPTENCGVTFSPLHFRGVNAQGFGDFDDGFRPNTPTGATGLVIPGCVVPDDYTRDLGDPDEALLSAALDYAVTGQCPTVSAQKSNDFAPAFQSGLDRPDPLADTPQVRALDARFGELDMTRPETTR